MNRKQFGKLVATLRQEREWTQLQLSSYSGIDAAALSQIERGVKKHLDPDLLLRLANSFELTTLGRMEFFLASTGLENGQMVRQPNAALATDSVSADRALGKMVRLVERLRSPAFLLDVYSDILAVNYPIFEFFRVPTAMMENPSGIAGGYNMIRLIFGKELAAKSHFLNNWDQFALSTMRFFRTSSLRYRATPYFDYLMKIFRDPTEYPFFDRFWRAASSIEQDRDGAYDHFTYDHDIFGHLSYVVVTTASMTAHGELLLNQYIPTDDATKTVFDRLVSQSGAGVIRLASWPAKQMS